MYNINLILNINWIKLKLLSIIEIIYSWYMIISFWCKVVLISSTTLNKYYIIQLKLVTLVKILYI